MKPIVNKEACIGCGACEGIDPEVFKLIDGRSEVQYQDAEGNMIDFETHIDAIERAIGACPVAAISWEKEEEAEPTEGEETEEGAEAGGAEEEGLTADPTVEPMPGLPEEDIAA